MKEIALALGGGGVKGYAHVGVLRALEREGYRIRAIAGTSAGALVGAAYVAGYSPDEIEACLRGMDQSKLYLRQAGDAPSMMGLAGVQLLLDELIGSARFKDTRIPFAATAVNMDTAQLLSLRRGRLVDAVMASIAVPGVFPHKVWENMRLIDGGILDPVPVSLARYLAPGLPVVAVVLSPPVAEWINPNSPRLLESLPFLSSYIGRLRIAQAFNIFLRSIDIAGAELTELRLQVDHPEVIVRPTVPHIGFLDTVNVSEVIQIGERGVDAALADLQMATGWRGWLQRQTSHWGLKRTVLTWENDCHEDGA